MQIGGFEVTSRATPDSRIPRPLARQHSRLSPHKSLCPPRVGVAVRPRFPPFNALPRW
jgi:hypothetical protein